MTRGDRIMNLMHAGFVKEGIEGCIREPYTIHTRCFARHVLPRDSKLLRVFNCLFIPYSQIGPTYHYDGAWLWDIYILCIIGYWLYSLSNQCVQSFTNKVWGKPDDLVNKVFPAKTGNFSLIAYHMVERELILIAVHWFLHVSNFCSTHVYKL